MAALFSADDQKVGALGQVVDLTNKLTPGPIYFRGHADIDWELVPTIARMDRDRWWAGRSIVVHNDLRQELSLLHRFRRRTYEHRGRVLSPWEALFLARHHGLPVRLLDWTTNPLVALYFACEHGRPTKTDGAIWWFTRRFWDAKHDIDTMSADAQAPAEIPGVRLIYPFYPTARMTVQSGLFTIHAHPWRDLRLADDSDFRETECDIAEGHRWTVPADAKPELLRELARFGVTSRTLFPELDGLVAGLLQDEVFRTEEEYADAT
jgi:hypothetical protein